MKKKCYTWQCCVHVLQFHFLHYRADAQHGTSISHVVLPIRSLFRRRSEERRRVAADAKTLLDYDPTHKPELPTGQVTYTAAAVMMTFPLAQHVADHNKPHHY